MAIKARAPRPGLLHHTDRGGQYVSREYKLILERAGIRSSMSREVLQVPRTVDSLILSLLKGSQNVREAIVCFKAGTSPAVYA
jgi:hypothetical protein